MDGRNLNRDPPDALSFPEALHHVASCNIANSLHMARKKYSRPPAAQQPPSASDQQTGTNTPWLVQLAGLVRALYPEVIIVPDISTMADGEEPTAAPPGCLVELRLLLIDKDWAYLFFDHAEHTLSSVTRFSPALLSGNNVKLLFLVFQLVKIFQVFAQRNIYTGDLNLKDFAVTETLEVQLRPVFSQLMSTAPPAVTPAAATTVTSDAPVSGPPAAAAPSFCDMVEAWVGGSLSNLDYLLYLNRLAGRSNGDPNFHPVLPWVSDFSSDSAISLRDLTKSKFRLNKGDEALDRTFERLVFSFHSQFGPVYFSESNVAFIGTYLYCTISGV